MGSKRVGAITLTLVLTFTLAAGPLMAANPGYDKGFADGKTFGMRAGQKKGFDDGYKKGLEDGHTKGMADAEAGIDNPNLPAPGQLPEATPPAPPAPPVQQPTEPTPPAPPAEEPPAQEPPAEEPPAEEQPPAEEPPAEEATEEEVGPKTQGTVKASRICGESLTEEALRLYPDLLPQAPSLEGVAEDVVVDPAGGQKDIAGTLVGENGLITDEDLEYSTEYSKGFALGYLEGYKTTYNAAHDEGYPKGYAEGYAKGQKEYKDLHYGADGQLLTPEQQYKKGRALLMQEKWEQAITRFNLVAAAGYDNEWVDDALYWKAWACYNTKQFMRAIKTVSQMMEILSDSELADDALYCKGMCYEYLQTGGFLGIGQKKHYLEAAECFYNLIAGYPSSPIVPNAYFKLGYNYERLKDKKAAIKAYRVVLSQYPNSSVAFKAQRRLHALGALTPEEALPEGR